jgi:23S rRNA (adenine1618-N6)-methyltransferase
MSDIYKKVHSETKEQLHPNNKHRERYDFKALINTNPALANYVSKNKYGDESIDFFNPAAVTCLNQTLLQHFYDIQHWSIPEGYLCPPIPGRADYIHHIAELLGIANNGKIPVGKNIKCLDVGVGANCVYPIIGIKEYGWSFVGSDIDFVSIDSVNQIVENNSFLKDKVTLRLQKQPNAIFSGIIEKDERFDLTICNPPFHASAKEAAEGSMRKLSNLKHKKVTKATLNFGGQKNELWCDGGEARFVGNMMQESKVYADSCLWFSSLISKQTNLDIVYKQLKVLKPVEIQTIPMKQGNKISRLVAWTFHSKAAQQTWMNERWK